MQCQRCGSTLYLDLRSVVDLIWQGYTGGRVYCMFGCPQAKGGWMVERAETPVEAEQVKAIRLGRWSHAVREFICQRCHKTAETRGSHTKRCEPCKKEIHQERERERARRKRQLMMSKGGRYDEGDCGLVGPDGGRVRGAEEEQQGKVPLDRRDVYAGDALLPVTG